MPRGDQRPSSLETPGSVTMGSTTCCVSWKALLRGIRHRGPALCVLNSAWRWHPGPCANRGGIEVSSMVSVGCPREEARSSEVRSWRRYFPAPQRCRRPATIVGHPESGSPRQGGEKMMRTRRGHLHWRVIPACAGQIREIVRRNADPQGSSPRVRGKSTIAAVTIFQLRGIPACARRILIDR